MVAPLYVTASGLLFHAGKILVLTVGLPARGKTHISRALERYLRWTGVKTQVISMGDYRRKTLGGAQKLPPDYFSYGARSPETEQLRKSVANGCEQLIWEFFDSGGQVVIYDANNGTRAAREAMAEKFENKGIHIIFLESCCDKQEVIERNIRSVKISSPDYKGWDPDKAVEDYYGRIKDRERLYEPVEELNWPYIRIFNVGEKILLNKIQGYLQSRIVFFLMNIHNRFRTIWFARSGQSLIEHSYKADSDLSPAGWEYAEKLKDTVLSRRMKVLQERGIDPAQRKLVIWTSTRRRAHHTAWPFVSSPLSEDFDVADNQPLEIFPDAKPDAPRRKLNPNQTLKLPIHGVVARDAPVNTPRLKPISDALADGLVLGGSSGSSTPLLSAKQPKVVVPEIKVVEKTQMLEINPGIWDGLTPDQAKKYYPEDWERFTKDPYSYRVPRAESYHDLSVRLEPILIELERESEDLLIIGHASVIRCLLAYLVGLPAAEIPAIEIARGDLLEIVPASYGVHSRAFHFWDGPGRTGEGGAGADGLTLGKDQNNFYENYAEDTKGKRITFTDGDVFGNAFADQLHSMRRDL
ncbi:hypothetical protein Agabi119p4_8006 [Agaricus bisporus var. burnettii]|uniref:6-phosphofructo-2-kinase domain-containing protein n=1 Tax=Agaricus bisporus var. burnettii TaxID=192524 RepID=A0A8H7EYL0_AGABI|nr:hypothetical protein Agabi119p4_8006 [Agaricus bisporus var. burnettii]